MVQSKDEIREKARVRASKWRKDNPILQKVRCRAWRQAHPLAVIRKRARRKGWAFNLTEEWYWRIVNQGVCQKTGLPFVINKAVNSPFQPSVDRINSDLWYTQDNCQIVCLIFNFAKNRFTDQDVYKFAKAFVYKYDNDSTNDSSSAGSSILLHTDRQEVAEVIRPTISSKHSRQN